MANLKLMTFLAGACSASSLLKSLNKDRPARFQTEFHTKPGRPKIMLYKDAEMRIRHKGLRALHKHGSAKQVPADITPRLRRILAALDDAMQPGEMNLPGLRLHRLHGRMAGVWAVRASGNWRVVFRFKEGEAVDVDLIDYH